MQVVQKMLAEATAATVTRFALALGGGGELLVGDARP
jgi:hypothetical protein